MDLPLPLGKSPMLNLNPACLLMSRDYGRGWQNSGVSLDLDTITYAVSSSFKRTRGF